MHNLKRILRNTGWLFSAQILTATLALLQGVMLTRALGPERFGVCALVVTFVLLVIQVFDSRIWESIIRFVPQFRARDDDRGAAATIQLCYWIEGGAGLVSFAVILATAEIGADWFIKDPTAAGLIRLYGILALINIPSEATSALLRVADRFDWLSYQSVATAALTTIGTGVVWWLEPTLQRFLLVQLVGAAVGVLILLVMGLGVARTMELPWWRPSALASLRGRYREVLRFIFLTNLTGTCRMITSRADVLVLGWFSSPAAVGVYELAKRLVTQLGSFAAPLYSSVFPEISKLMAAGEYAEVRRLQKQLSATILAAVLVICVLGTIAAPPLIPFFFGADFAPAIVLLQVLLWRYVWLPLVWFPGFLLSLGRVGTSTALAWIDALIYLGLLVVLVPVWSGLGAAWATTARGVLWLALAIGLLWYLDRTGWYRGPSPGRSAPTID